MMKITIEAAFDDPLKAAVFFSHMTTCSRELGDAPAAAKPQPIVAKQAPVALPPPTPAPVPPPKPESVDEPIAGDVVISGPMPSEPAPKRRGRPPNPAKSLERMQNAVANAQPLPVSKPEPAPAPTPLEEAIAVAPPADKAPVVAPAPASAPAGEMTFETLHVLARDLLSAKKIASDQLRKILNDYGVIGLSQLPPSKRNEVADKFNALAAAAA